MHVFPAAIAVVTSAVLAWSTSCLAVSDASAASPTQAAATVVLPNVDDHHLDPAYAPLLSQEVVWDVKHCPGPELPRTTPEPTQFTQFVGRLSAATAGTLREAWGLRAPQQRRAGVECALIDVPKDWSDPARGLLKVGLLRPQGVTSGKRLLLSNPGGPGGSGLFFGLEAQSVLGTQDTHLAVGVDPRGVGLSSRATCPALPAPAPGQALTGAAKVKAQAEQLARCQSEPDTLVPFIDTVNTAQDFNLVRHLLGYARADYFGVSYGTWLGATLKKMFPSRFDRVVLDSTTDWASGSLATVFGKHFPRGYQASLERVVFPWLGRHHAAYGLGDTGATVAATVAMIQDKATGPGGSPFLATMVRMNLVMAARNPTTFLTSAGEVLREALREVDKPSPPGLTALAAPRRTNATRIAVVCNDSGSGGSLHDEMARIERLAASYPLMGAAVADATCVNWPRPATLTRAILDRPLTGVLMVQNENDAATPYHGAFLTRAREGAGARMLLVDDGHGHVAFFQDCVAKAGYSYLSQGVYPPGDVHCQAGPLPAEKAVYEFGFGASPKRPLSPVMLHHTGDIVDPEIDDDAQVRTRTSAVDTEGARRFTVSQLREEFAEVANLAG